MGWVSPNELLDHAKKEMIDNREPETQDDWVLVVNYMACNINKDVAHSAMKLIKTIYQIPLSDEYIAQIVDFQNARKEN